MRRKAKGKRPGAFFWWAVWVLVCGALFLALPPMLTWLSHESALVGLWLLVWTLCPVLTLVSTYCAARRGVTALLAWTPAAIGYLLLPLWGVRPEWPVLGGSCLLGIIAAAVAEQRNLRKGRK